MMLAVWFQAPLQLRLNIFFLNLIPSFLTFLEPLENSEVRSNYKYKATVDIFCFHFCFVSKE